MTQLQQHLDRLRIGERVLLPGPEVPLDEFLRRLHPGPDEKLIEGRAPLLAFRDPSEVIFRRTERGDRVGQLIVVTVRGADDTPEFVVIDGVPGRERAAPVEYHCRYGHGCSSYDAGHGEAHRRHQVDRVGLHTIHMVTAVWLHAAGLDWRLMAAPAMCL